ncbi:MAG: helix-turn-helix transcriptional regulator [Chitinophagaceae bacterium]
MKKKYTKSNYNKLLELLYQIRTGRAMRQSDLAQLLDVPQSFISKIESGERKIDIVTFLEICDALEIHPTDVISQFLNKIK